MDLVLQFSRINPSILEYIVAMATYLLHDMSRGDVDQYPLLRELQMSRRLIRHQIVYLFQYQ